MKIILFLLALRVVSSDDSANSAIFVKPPVSEEELKALNIDIGNWTHDDWRKEIGNTLLEGAITDKRWQSFTTTYGTSLSLPVTNEGSVSFSVYLLDNTTKLKFYFLYDNRFHVYPVQRQDINKWVHYIILTINDKISILERDNVLWEMDDVLPYQEIIRSTEPIFWKLHKYKYRRSNKTTQDVPTSLKLTSSGKKCVVIYVSLGKNCFLDVIVKTINKNETKKITLNNKEQRTLINPWQAHTIEIDPDNDNELLFYRRQRENNTNGSWAFDVRFCSDPVETYDFAVQRDNLTQYTCEILDDDKPDKYNTDAEFSCPVGYLGKSCNVSCASILGQENHDCAGYKICQNSSNCVCAWGYQEQFCEKSCENRTWGLSCKQSCSPSCEKCSISTGQCCSEPHSGQLTTTIIIIQIAIGILALVCIILIGLSYKKSIKCGNTNNPDAEILNGSN